MNKKQETHATTSPSTIHPYPQFEDVQLRRDAKKTGIFDAANFTVSHRGFSVYGYDSWRSSKRQDTVPVALSVTFRGTECGLLFVYYCGLYDDFGLFGSHLAGLEP
ncbi:hypothetical protein PoB_001014800 [Plakobranchus ocellatus]|uniref:Uncharacterized protein n=1 Tax=Plakobranchus ocellatus TaxID=259542 RepID=A0AAV3YM71_9GAST|nr:hypothetical protein PoB_001014800 [Plakobranchus ocellatus]